jgi:recombinase-like zinc beta ribbon protein
VYDRLQAALDERAFKVTNRSAKASPLLGVAICGMCGRPMHLRQHHNKKRGKTYRYYQCVGGASSGGGGGGGKDHEANIIKGEDLETLVEEGFLFQYGLEPVREHVYIPAENHKMELDEHLRAVAEITQLLGTATSTAVQKLYADQLAALDARIAELEALPVSVARWKWRKLPETYAEAWERAETPDRRQLLLKREVTATVAVRGRVARHNPGALEFHIVAPLIEEEDEVPVLAR